MIFFLFQEENESDQIGLLYAAMNKVTPTSVCPQNIHIADNTGNVPRKAPLFPKVPSFAIEQTEEALVKAPSRVDNEEVMGEHDSLLLMSQKRSNQNSVVPWEAMPSCRELG